MSAATSSTASNSAPESSPHQTAQHPHHSHQVSALAHQQQNRHRHSNDQDSSSSNSKHGARRAFSSLDQPQNSDIPIERKTQSDVHQQVLLDRDVSAYPEHQPKSPSPQKLSSTNAPIAAEKPSSERHIPPEPRLSPPAFDQSRAMDSPSRDQQPSRKSRGDSRASLAHIVEDTTSSVVPRQPTIARNQSAVDSRTAASIANPLHDRLTIAESQPQSVARSHFFPPSKTVVESQSLPASGTHSIAQTQSVAHTQSVADSPFLAQTQSMVQSHSGVQTTSHSQSNSQSTAQLPAPRWRPTPQQKQILQCELEKNPYPDISTKAELAEQMGVNRPQISKWFQHRREALAKSGNFVGVSQRARRTNEQLSILNGESFFLVFFWVSF